MSISGSWALTMSTPMGEQKINLKVEEKGAAFTGVMTSADGDLVEVKNGAAEGGRFKWTADVVKPMPIKLTFDVAIEGDTINGTFRPGMFPPQPVTGVRV